MPKKITQMDKAAAQTLSTAAMAALEKVAKEHGVNVERARSSSYDPTTGTWSVKITFTVAGGEVKAWERDRALVDFTGALEPVPHGFQFTQGGKTFTCESINLRATKRPVITSCDDGKVYNWPVGAIVKAYKEATA